MPKTLLDKFRLTFKKIGLAISGLFGGLKSGLGVLYSVNGAFSILGGSMGIVAGWATVIGLAIGGAIWAYDHFTVSLEESREKLATLKEESIQATEDLQSANNELKTTQQRISELESKGKLTFTEAEELNNLRKQNNELQRSIDLLKLEQELNQKEVRKTFVETMTKDTEDPFEYEINPDGKSTFVSDNYLVSETEYIEYQFETRNKLVNEASMAKTLEEKERIQKEIDEIDEFLKEKNEQWAEDISGVEYIESPKTKDDEKVNEWLDYVYDFQDEMAIAMGGENAKSNAFNRLIDNWKFDDVTQKLQDLGKKGEVTAEMLNNPLYDEFIQKLVDIGFISDDTEGSLRFVASAFNNSTVSAKQYVDSLDTADAIDAFIQNIDTEAKALGTTKDEMIKLVAQHITLNNTKLSLSDKVEQIRKLGAMAGWSQGKILDVIELMNRASGNVPKSLVSTDGDRSGSAQLELYRLFGGWQKIDTSGFDDDYTGDDDDNKTTSTKSIPDPEYSHPTDTILNGLNLTARQIGVEADKVNDNIDKLLEAEDYDGAIQALNDYIFTKRRQITALQESNVEISKEADNVRKAFAEFENGTYKDINTDEWFNEFGEATVTYENFLANAPETHKKYIEDIFGALQKLKQGWIENGESIVDINNDITESLNTLEETTYKSIDKAYSDIERLAEREKDINDKRIKDIEQTIEKQEALLGIGNEKGELQLTDDKIWTLVVLLRSHGIME